MVETSEVIFLSHASVDRPVARQIRDELEGPFVKVWLSEVEIRVGDSIQRKVEQGLNEATVLLLLISSAAISSSWVMREFNSFLHLAMSDGRNIIPCRLDNCVMPGLIADVRYADFTKSFNDGMADVRSAVRIAEAISHQKKIDELKQKLLLVFSKRAGWSEREQAEMLLDVQSCCYPIMKMREPKKGFFRDVVEALGCGTDWDDRLKINEDITTALLAIRNGG